MIKNAAMLREFEDALSREEGRLPFDHAMRIFTSMWNEAKGLGIVPFKDPLEGIEVDIKIAKVLNSCFKKSFPD